MDAGVHSSQLREKLAGSNSFRGVQASTVLNEPAVISYANEHFRSGVIAPLSDAISESLADISEADKMIPTGGLEPISEEDDFDYYSANNSDGLGDSDD